MSEAAATPNLPEFSVSEIAGLLKRTVEDAFPFVRVRGEISGLKFAVLRPRLFRPEGRQGGPERHHLEADRAAPEAQAGAGAGSRLHRADHDLSRLLALPDHRRADRTRRRRRADGDAGGAQEEARRRRPVRRRAQEAAAVPARCDRRHHFADGRGDPRHHAPAERPLSAPRAAVAGGGAGREGGRGSGRRHSRVQRARRRRRGCRGPMC